MKRLLYLIPLLAIGLSAAENPIRQRLNENKYNPSQLDGKFRDLEAKDRNFVTRHDITATQIAGGMIGEIKMYVSASTPTYWMVCHGQSLSTTTYSDLYEVIGYSYGGSGANFNIPNLRGAFPKGAGTQSIGGVSYSGTLGPTGGAANPDSLQGHKHLISHDTANVGNQAHVRTGSAADGTNVFGGAITTDGTNGTPRTGTVTEPANVVVTFIIYAGK